MFNKLIISLLIVILTIPIFSQTVDNKQKETEKRTELEKDAVVFLRETFSDVAVLRTPENRISFNAELAGLMWFHDEKQSRSMFNSVITDFKQMLLQIDAQLSSTKISAGEANYISLPFFPASDSKSKLLKKFSKAMSVRQQISTAFSEHDPLAAHAFFLETGQAVTNPELRKQLENRDEQFEMKLLQAIAEKDSDKGIEAARKSLAKGLNWQHIDLLKKLYAKDAKTGAAFGKDLIDKIKSENSKKEEVFQYLKSIVSAAAENQEAIKSQTAPTPMFAEQDVRDVAELMSQIILKDNNYLIYGGEENIKLLKQFLPGRAIQIEQTIAVKKKAQKQVVVKGDGGEEDGDAANSADSEEAEAAMSKYEKMREQEKAMEKLRNLDGKKLPEEERKKVLAEARKMIAEIDDPNMRTLALSTLAAQIARFGDKETASEIIREAERFINPQPKSYLDFMQSWMLASSYSEINTDKAFPILEETVSRLNETISAFIKVGEFIDVNEDMVEDGEVQIGTFGGEITNNLLRSVGQTDNTLRNLSTADFTRTKLLTSKFDRPEVRIMAKMLVLRAVLGKEKTEPDSGKVMKSEAIIISN